MLAYAKPQQTKKEESERLRGERERSDRVIDLRFERWQVVRFSELCWGKAMVGYAKPNKGRKKKQNAKRRERSNQVYWS